jgi:hypothetical protein
MTMTLKAMVSRLSLASPALVLNPEPAAAQVVAGLTGAQTFGLIIAGLVLICLAFGVYLTYAGLRNRKLAKVSETWPTAGGTVLASEITKRTHRDQKTRVTYTYYTPQIRYGYKVGGADYEGSIIRFGDLERSSITLPQELVSKYPAGAAVGVRYDPADPNRATLETKSAGGGQIAAGVLFVVVPLLAVGIGSFVFGFVGEGTNPAPEEQHATPN